MFHPIKIKRLSHKVFVPLGLLLVSTMALSSLLLGCNTQKLTTEQAPSIPKLISGPSKLLTEGINTPLNVHNANPRLSWHANVKQQAYYQIQVANTQEQLNKNNPNLWDSGKVSSRQSVNIAYNGSPLKTNDFAYWQVRVWANGAVTPSGWSKIARWEMGLLERSDWQAKWLQVSTPEVTPNQAAVKQWVDLVGIVENEDGTFDSPAIEPLREMPTASLFRHQFTLDKKVVSAKLHSTAGGYYEIFINGKKVKDRIMDPGQTDFDKRILYNTDEVTDLLYQGTNAIGVHLGSGWYNENIAFSRWKNPDGKFSNKSNRTYSYGQPTFIAQLELTFSDGTKKLVTSNEQWKSHASATVKEGIFSGELFNANNLITGWNNVNTDNHTNNTPGNHLGNDLNNWQAVKVLNEWPTKQLAPQLLPPIKPVKAMLPKKILNPRDNVWVFDFGQNFTGIPTLHLDKLNLSNGQAVFLRYAEWQDGKGNISQLSGGSWATHLNAVDGYIAARTASNQQTWTPSFTWHGFRYIEVTGLTQKPTLDILSAQLIRSEVERVGSFESSDPLINRIHETALWSYESNLMSVPLDCPIREKAGWTGDAHAALITGNYNFNMQNFWSKYLGDFKTALKTAATVVPGKRTGGGKVDWAVAEVFIAWEHYRHHGDIQILANQYQSLLKYMTFGQSQMSDYLIASGYGDWCDPVPSPGIPRVGGRGTPQWTTTAVTSTALFAQAANFMSKIAKVLNKPEEEQHYKILYANLSKGFHQAFYNEKTGHYGSQTADSMALQFGIAPLALRQSVADALNKDVVEKWKGHSSVGALGQTYLYLSLSDYGYTDTAFNIFKAKAYPGYSYLFDTLNGTTLWERKGAFDPSKGRGPLRSLNHPFHSGYDGWFYQGLGGIRPMENSIGYQEFILKPVFPSGLNKVDVNYMSGYGQIKSQWQRENNTIVWKFLIPNNTSAWVHLPNKEQVKYHAGEYTLVINI